MKFKTSFFTASVFIFYLGERKIYQIKTYTLFNRDDVRRFLMLWLYYTTPILTTVWRKQECFRNFQFLSFVVRNNVFEILVNVKSVGAFIGRPPWWYCLLIHITFDVMKIMYSILHAMRAIVCNAHELCYARA